MAFPEITLRSLGDVPPIRLFEEPRATRIPARAFGMATDPVTSVPMWHPSTTLSPPVINTRPRPGARLIARPRTVELPALITSPFAIPASAEASISTMGALA